MDHRRQRLWGVAGYLSYESWVVRRTLQCECVVEVGVECSHLEFCP